MSSRTKTAAKRSSSGGRRQKQKGLEEEHEPAKAEVATSIRGKKTPGEEQASGGEVREENRPMVECSLCGQWRDVPQSVKDVLDKEPQLGYNCGVLSRSCIEQCDYCESLQEMHDHNEEGEACDGRHVRMKHPEPQA
mmetsp:Transcript_20516/g.35268  ORF Transcript_20516/g.35268 Transcript_20516/m.35268 type:complete len:137 (-) Transcript_20516:362-772(-)|eukprot:CAMPEP_0196657880 /NCGR_PEP_ID=MMETSP1086-20130531/26220_1 /TAXON_ID=77921 /ORGANISM="Cyanoptyche  gloeocystis , Strain SAG4.97" /LENGTH=136 /DNA_ID=CAMNT_0041991193 /DNA_START=164 /DNA_END=574 /DNA_ORIENTATION=-